MLVMEVDEVLKAQRQAMLEVETALLEAAPEVEELIDQADLQKRALQAVLVDLRVELEVLLKMALTVKEVLTEMKLMHTVSVRLLYAQGETYVRDQEEHAQDLRVHAQGQSDV